MDDLRVLVEGILDDEASYSEYDPELFPPLRLDDVRVEGNVVTLELQAVGWDPADPELAGVAAKAKAAIESAHPHLTVELEIR